MNKLNAFVSILKFINGRNTGADSLKAVCDYTTDTTKTKGGKLVATHGCSLEHPVEDMLANKRLHNKTHGKQYEHYVLAPCPNGSDKSPKEVLKVAAEIAATLFPEHMSVTAVHIDSTYTHAHTVLDALNAVTGHKSSRSQSDLNKLKQKANNILQKYGFEIITASANDFMDYTDCSNEEGFNFLELNESEFITESDLSGISNYTANVGLLNNSYCIEQLSKSLTKYIYGDTFMNNKEQCAAGTQTTSEQVAPSSTVEAKRSTYNHYKAQDFGCVPKYTMPGNTLGIPQAQSFANQKPVPEVLPQAVPANNNFAPAMKQPQGYSAPTTTTASVPATIETMGNGYPNTSVITGPTFRIKGDEDSDFSGLNELVEQTTAYAQQHQREAANLALAMQEYGQKSGSTSNVAVYAGPIFDINLTGNDDNSNQYRDIYDYYGNEGDYGMFK